MNAAHQLHAAVTLSKQANPVWQYIMKGLRPLATRTARRAAETGAATRAVNSTLSQLNPALRESRARLAGAEAAFANRGSSTLPWWDHVAVIDNIRRNQYLPDLMRAKSIRGSAVAKEEAGRGLMGFLKNEAPRSLAVYGTGTAGLGTGGYYGAKAMSSDKPEAAAGQSTTTSQSAQAPSQDAGASQEPDKSQDAGASQEPGMLGGAWEYAKENPGKIMRMSALAALGLGGAAYLNDAWKRHQKEKKKKELAAKTPVPQTI